jgi:hypothetical protein
VAWLPGRPPAAETAGQEESVAAGQVGLRSGSGSSR